MAPRFLAVEEAKRLVFRLRQSRQGGVVVQLVAATAGEGTSSLSRDLAVVAASMGTRVLLLDLGVPQGAQRSALTRDFGVALLAETPLEPAPGGLQLYRAESSPLRVGEPDWASESLNSAEWDEIFAALRHGFDLVIIDSAPLAAAYDSIARAPLVDLTLLVVQAEKTRVAVAQALRNRLLDVGGHIGGALLNRRRFHVPEFLYRRV